MTKKILIVAPHPDDETLGCAGTILKHRQAGDEVHWLIITEMSANTGYIEQQISARAEEVKQVSRAYTFNSTTCLAFPPASLDQVPAAELIGKISIYIKDLQPEVVYIPFRNDVHSDHKVTFDAVISSCKSFRAPFIKRLLAYETLSETDFNLKPGATAFTPNTWVDIADYLDNKLSIIKIYESEFKAFPFPRSEEAIVAQARIRGIQCNSHAAEAFMLLKEIL